MFYLYVLKCKRFKKSYVGITTNLSRRLKEHNAGKSIYTSRYGPWKLIYKEKIKSRTDARKREKYFKSAAGRKYLKKHVFRAD